MVQALKVAEGFHRQLPERILTYLRDVQGIPEVTIYRHFLGWDSARIPMKGRD